MLCSAPVANFFALEVQTVILKPSASSSIWSSMFGSSLFTCFPGRLDICSVTFCCSDAKRRVAPSTGVSRMALPSSRALTVPRSVIPADTSNERTPSALTTSCLNHWLPLDLRSIVRPASTMRLPASEVHSSRGVSTPDAIHRCSPDLSPILAIGSPCTVSTGGGGGDVDASSSASCGFGGGGSHSSEPSRPLRPAISQLRPLWPNAHSPWSSFHVGSSW